MIGAGAMVMESLSVLIPGALILVCLWYIFIKKHKIALVFLVPIAAILILTGLRFYHMNQNHRFLHHLGIGEVAAIRINDTIIADPGQIEPIVKALNDHRWFSSNHGGWAETLPMSIKDKNKRYYDFRIGFYLRQEGAVIEFMRQKGSARFSDGYGFSPTLPAVLEQAGLALPREQSPRPEK